MERSPSPFPIAAVFAVHGAVGGAFATRIPWIQERIGAGPGELGLALLAPAVGTLLAMPTAGRIVHRLGGRAAVRLLLAAWCLALVLPPLAPDLAVLWIALLLYGAVAGLADVAMNAEGVLIEMALGRPVMSRLHGMWSIGALTGAGTGALAAHAGVDARLHLAVTALVLLGCGLLASAFLPSFPAGADAVAPPRFALPGREVLGIGLVGFCAVVAEGAAADWSAVYLRDVAGAGPGVAAVSYTAFALTMALARLGGDAVVARLGPVRTVRLSGALAVLGGVAVVAARTPAPAIAGFGLIGLGVAVVIPLAFTAGGRAAADPGQGVAGIATLTYSCLLIAPGVIGGVAALSSLPVSFALVTAALVVMTLTAGHLRPAAP
ncbi:MFS transporter [Actinocorallia libanotica]|uniref:MFS transporter n=1 Tax=Actinocorallia libanotica TaxID=46162 RepID=A0ABP4CI03_9ACTN